MAKVDTGLIELALKHLQFAVNRYRFVFFKPIKELQLGGWAGCDLLNFVLAENVGAEYLIAIKGNGNGRSHFIKYLDRVVGTPASCILHVRLGPEFDAEPSVSQICFHQTVYRTVPLQIRFGVGHQAEAEAKKFENGGLSCSAPPIKQFNRLVLQSCVRVPLIHLTVGKSLIYPHCRCGNGVRTAPGSKPTQVILVPLRRDRRRPLQVQNTTTN